MEEFSRKDDRIRLLHHTRNEGKGQAIFTGWKAASGTVLLLLDADLKNLTPGHLRALLAPVLDHRADMTLGLFWGGHIHTDLSHWGAPFLTGQRALRTVIMKHVSYEAAHGYGFEIALTVAASQNKYRARIVPMSGVWHPPSEFHRGGWNGVKWRARMYAQILRALWVATRERYPRVVEFFSSILKP
jgi:glycosyltransferase involved in cell wall biosynthesis